MLKNRVVCLLLLLSLLLCGCRTEDVSQDLFSGELLVPEKTNYKTTQVELGSFSLMLEGNAFVEYPVLEDIYWKTADSYLQTCNVSIGDTVKKDDVLAVFDVKTDEIELKELKLQLQREQESFNAEKDERIEAIRQAEEKAQRLTGTEREIALLQAQKKQVAYEEYVYTASQDIATLREKIDTIESTVANNTLTAPFDGVVTAVTHYKEGALVSTGKVFITLRATDRVLVKIGSGTADLYCGMDMAITVGKGSGENAYLGTVVSVPHILPASVSGNYAVLTLDRDISVQQSNSTITYSKNTLLVQDVIVINRRAVYREDGKSYVYVFEDDMPKKRYITEGLSSADTVWVLDGLEPGQTLVLN